MSDSPSFSTEPADVEHKIMRLQGPILVLGASGFVGANLVRMLCRHRNDVIGTSGHHDAWRLEGLPAAAVRVVDLLVEANLKALLSDTRPRTIFDCVAYGAYSFETDAQLIYRTNFNLVAKLLALLADGRIACYVHAGSSSEYGDKASGPHEDELPAPNSDYAVSKVAAANVIAYFGKKKHLPCANLRLYSVYGPLEDSARLIPNLVRHGIEGRYPEFVHPDISRDFLYVDDACHAFVDTALGLREDDFGESFNIGTGHKTTIAEVARIAGELFDLRGEPVFTMPNRTWDVSDWYACVDKARTHLSWEPRVTFREGLERTAVWYRSLGDRERYLRSSKQHGLDTKYSVTAIIACYKDAQAIPVMYRRLKETFAKLNIEYEIIFVNDCSPDDSEEVIREITRSDRRVVGISHSRNFGSQAAFSSGMGIMAMNACVLLDGDLQDPPEVIEQMVAKWREGYDVVFGRRVKREAPILMQWAYKLFYRIFDTFSYVHIPHDAGDFSLIDKRVARILLRFPERDLFLRGIRAFAGFRQTGIDYMRPERMFGRTTNSLLRNLGWAKKGILSFSNVPLNVLSFASVLMLAVSVILGATQIVSRLLFPSHTPSGITTLLLEVLFFGSINLFAVALIGEYIAKVFEEVKRRPLFIRKSIIRDGDVRIAGEDLDTP